MVVMLVLVVVGGFVAFDATRSFGTDETSVSVEVRGPFIEVRVAPPGGRFQPGDSVKVEDRLVTCDGDQPCRELSTVLPAEAFDPGRQSLSVAVRRGDDREESTTEFDLPASAHDPWLRVTCGGSKPGAPLGPAATRVKIHGNLRSKTFKRLPQENALGMGNCSSLGSGAFDLNIRANMDAEVTVDGAPIKLDDGQGYFSVPVVELLGQMVVKGGKVDTENPVERALLVNFKRADKEALKHEIVLSIDAGQSLRMAAFSVLEAAAKHKQMPWPPLDNEGSRNYYAFISEKIDVKDQGTEIELSPRPRTTIAAPDGTSFRTVTRIAVGRPIDPKPTRCTGYKAMDGGPMTTTVVLFQSAMDVVAYGDDGRPTNRRTFARPAKKECPSHASGERDVNLQGPSLKLVAGWLRTLR
ncbi:MAG: hypothetical protein AAGN82_26400 [Myxococcota bacterium]